MIFNNRRFFKRQAIQILKSGLKINKKTLFDSIEYEVSFERMNNKLKIKTSVNNGLLVIAFFLIATGFIVLSSGNKIVSIIFFLLAFAIIVTAFLTILKTTTIACYDNDNIELYFTKRTKGEVIGYANQIIASGNSYLLNKYSKIDKALPIESQLNNLDFLRNKEIISEEHFENLKDQLLGRENKSSIGFNQ